MPTAYRRIWAIGFFLIHLIQGSPIPFTVINVHSHAEIIRYGKSAEMHNYMDESMDPCENFYKFTCGNYYRLNPPNEMPYQASVFQTLTKSFNRKLSQLLMNADEVSDPNDRKVKDFYQSCMNLPLLQHSYTDKLKEIIGEFGQMPALVGSEWRESEFDWLKTVAEIAHRYGIRIIVGYVNEVDAANNTIVRMHILPQDSPLGNPSIYRDETYENIRRNKNRSRREKLEMLLGLEPELAEQTVNEIYEFEVNLFGSTKSSETKTAKGERNYEEIAQDDIDDDYYLEDNRSWNLFLTTIEEMHRIYYPRLDIKRLIRIAFGSLPSEPVYDLLVGAHQLTHALNITPKRIVANYIFFHLLDKMNMFEYNGNAEDKTKLEDFCIEKTKSYFGRILNNIIYRQFTTKQMEEDVQIMFQTIKTTFRNILLSEKLAWMEENTLRYTLEKLTTIRLEINSYEGENFTKEFAPLTIDNRDFIDNLKSIYALNALKSREILNEPPQPYENAKMSFTPSYVLVENLIRVPVSILQPYYLWSAVYSNALKFGTLGFLIAHELIHAFDSEGRNYDKFGNEYKWWDKASSKYFLRQTQCFAKQYGNYSYDGQLMPEPRTQGENIADNGGLHVAYEAYLQWYGDARGMYGQIDGEVMPRLNYSGKQLFFIGYGQLWCTAIHPDVRFYLASKDDHAPGEIRVIGTVSNSEEFSNVFNCPKDSAMNPGRKCSIY